MSGNNLPTRILINNNYYLWLPFDFVWADCAIVGREYIRTMLPQLSWYTRRCDDVPKDVFNNMPYDVFFINNNTAKRGEEIYVCA